MRLDTLSTLFLATVAFISIPLASRKPPGHTLCLFPVIRYLFIFPLPLLLLLPSLLFLSLTELNAGLVGLGLTYTVSLAGMFQYSVRQSAEVENTVRSRSSQLGCILNILLQSVNYQCSLYKVLLLSLSYH